jgi:hypothetical protein
MNPTGVPVFYGAMDADTCINEIRLPVNAYSIVAKFNLIKPIKVIDLTLLNDFSSKLDIFEKNYDKLAPIYQFLKRFHEEISKPILPSDEQLQYIPTQVISEYLEQSFKPKVNGIIYRSAQSKNGKNIVLFNSSSMIMYKTPLIANNNIKYDFAFGEFECFVFEKHSNVNAKKADKVLNNKNAYLELNQDSISLIQAESIHYTTARWDIIAYNP